MQTWKMEVTLKVANSWVADGFNLSQPLRIEEVEEKLQSMIPYAYGHEVQVKVKITSAPKAKTIEQLQNGDLEIKD